MDAAARASGDRLLVLPTGDGRSSGTPERLAYSDFLNRVDASHVTSVTVDNDGAVDGHLDTGKEFKTQGLPTALTNGTNGVEQTLTAHNVKITGKQRTNSSLLQSFLASCRCYC